MLKYFYLFTLVFYFSVQSKDAGISTNSFGVSFGTGRPVAPTIFKAKKFTLSRECLNFVNSVEDRFDLGELMTEFYQNLGSGKIDDSSVYCANGLVHNKNWIKDLEKRLRDSPIVSISIEKFNGNSNPKRVVLFLSIVRRFGNGAMNEETLVHIWELDSVRKKWSVRGLNELNGLLL